MPLIADAHVHLYDLFDPGLFFHSARKNLTACGDEGDLPVLFFTESSTCRAFERLRDGTFPLPDSIQVSPTQEETSIRITVDGQDMWVIAGRQVVTRERVEILALGHLDVPEDGQPAAELIPQLIEKKAMPVLAWAAGKWMFGRAKVVAELCSTFGDHLWLGDSRLRPVGWPTPGPMRSASLPVLAGSDPLPVPGEESECGRYAIRIPGEVDMDSPTAAIREALRQPIELRGQRNSLPGFLKRFTAHHRAKSSVA